MNKSTGEDDCQFEVQKGKKAPPATGSRGIRLNCNVANVVFNTYGFSRFVDNNMDDDLFVPQGSAAEFAAFLNASTTDRQDWSWDYAIDNGVSASPLPFEGCEANLFSPNPQAISIAGNDAEPPLQVFAGYSRFPQTASSSKITVGKLETGGAVQFQYNRVEDPKDCVSDNQGTKACSSVVFLQTQEIKYVTKKSEDFLVKGTPYHNYLWYLDPDASPNPKASLYVKVGDNPYQPVANCNEGYPAKIDGVCGSATVGTTATKPAANLCREGNATQVSGNGPWTWTCNGVGTGATSVNCTAGAPECPLSSVSWQVGDYGCTGTTSGTIGSGSTTSVLAAGVNKGNANFQCNAGTLQVQSGATCSSAVTCAAGTYVTWSASGYTCGGSASSSTEVDKTTTVTSSNGRSGSGVFLCGSTGLLTYQSGTCSAASCLGATMSWGSSPSCSGYLASAGSGLPSTVTSTNGNSGSATYTCNNGSWSGPTLATCTGPTCPEAGKVWVVNGIACAGTLPQTNSGASKTIMTVTGYNGTYTCNNGTWSSETSPTCSANTCAPTSKTWSGTVTSCTGMTGVANSGSTTTATSTSGGSGTATFACENGGLSGPTFSSCNASCAATEKTWTVVSGATCRGTVPGMAAHRYQSDRRTKMQEVHNSPVTTVYGHYNPEQHVLCLWIAQKP